MYSRKPAWRNLCENIMAHSPESVCAESACAQCGRGLTVRLHYCVAWQPPWMPKVVAQRLQAVADELRDECVLQAEYWRTQLPARGAGGAREHRERCEGAGRGLVWHARAEDEVHGHHLVNNAVRTRPDRAENPCCRPRVRLAPELGGMTSGSTRLSRTYQCSPLEGSTALHKADVALNAQRRR